MTPGNPPPPEGKSPPAPPPRFGDPASAFRLQPSARAGICLSERYRILGLLASGGTSEVYLATDEQSGEQVMIKWLTARAGRDSQLRERFVLSAHVTMAVDHPSVLRVFGVEQPPDAPPYLVMEALAGEPFSDYLGTAGTMPEALVLRLAREVASGLVAAHQVGIIHRDIKPGNLFLVGPKGAPNAIKIIDFGLAKDMQDPEAGPSSTNLVLGTAQYMAPEQVLADPVDARTDVYAFGVLLFRALTGQLPFDLDPGVDLFSHQIFSPAPPPSWLAESLDPRLEQLILRCMRKHPENRYPSMQALLTDLETISGLQSQGKFAVPPLVRDPDLYKPRNQKGRDAAEALADYFGTEAPPPPTSRLGSDSPPEELAAARGPGFKAPC